MEVTIPFKTHFACTDNKVKANRYMKANGQILYNQSLSRFARNYFMTNMHDYIMDYLEGYKVSDFPIEIKLTIYLIRNYQSVRRLKGEIRFPPNIDLEPNYDLDNIALIWRKAILDSLTLAGVIPDDNVNYIRKITDEIKFVSNPLEMKINLKTEKYEES